MIESNTMSDKLTFKERLFNRIYAVPAVAQLWAKLTAARTTGLVDLSGDIPFAKFDKPFRDCKVALLTTGGVHLPEQMPFDMENPDGDATYREIPGDVDVDRIMITHKYYDHTDADADLNVVFPLSHFHDLAAAGAIGSLASTHYGFMGHIDGEQLNILNRQSAPEVAAKLRADGVDFAFLTPA